MYIDTYVYAYYVYVRTCRLPLRAYCRRTQRSGSHSASLPGMDCAGPCAFPLHARSRAVLRPIDVPGFEGCRSSRGGYEGTFLGPNVCEWIGATRCTHVQGRPRSCMRMPVHANVCVRVCLRVRMHTCVCCVLSCGGASVCARACVCGRLRV